MKLAVLAVLSFLIFAGCSNDDNDLVDVKSLPEGAENEFSLNVAGSELVFDGFEFTQSIEIPQTSLIDQVAGVNIRKEGDVSVKVSYNYKYETLEELFALLNQKDQNISYFPETFDVGLHILGFSFEVSNADSIFSTLNVKQPDEAFFHIANIYEDEFKGNIWLEGDFKLKNLYFDDLVEGTYFLKFPICCFR